MFFLVGAAALSRERKPSKGLFTGETSRSSTSAAGLAQQCEQLRLKLAVMKTSPS